MTTRTIPMDPQTQRFFQGVATGNRLVEEHADVPFPDYQTRVRTFWFFAGALAVDEHGIGESDDFTMFATGLKTREPEDPDREAIDLVIDQWLNGAIAAPNALTRLITLLRKD